VRGRAPEKGFLRLRQEFFRRLLRPKQPHLKRELVRQVALLTAPQETLAQGLKEVTQVVESINLDPRYSTKEIPGKCIKCLAEQELNNCLIELLGEEGENEELQQRFEMLVSFLKSPESQRLRDESERYLAEGKQVTARIYIEAGKPKYELKVN